MWRATYKDLAPSDGCIALDESKRRGHWAQLLAKDSSSLSLVVEHDGQLVAFCHAGPAANAALEPSGEIVHLYVRNDVQGSGLGSTLFSELSMCLRQQGYQRIRLAVVKGNDQGVRFYERHGGICIGEFEAGELWRSTNLIYEWSE